MKKIKILLPVFISISVLFACQNTENKNPVKTAEKQNDERFEKPDQKNAQLLVDAWLSNTLEMRLADTARKFVTSDDGKRLAGLLTDAHATINDRITKLAAAKQITLPTDITDQQKRKLENLKENKAEDFDKAFSGVMVKEQDDAIKLYEKSAADARDADIKNFFVSTLPELRSHYDASLKAKEALDK